MRSRLTAVCLVVFLTWTATAHAQIEANTGLVITNIAYTYSQPESGDESLNGVGLSLAWEQVTWDRQMSIGFGGGYYSSWFDRSSDQFSYNRLPFFATFKGLFGPPNYTGYLGVGVGATIDRLEVTGDAGIEERRTEANFALLVPLGIYIAPNPKVGFNFNVSYMYSNTHMLQNNSFFAFCFGIVFLH